MNQTIDKLCKLAASTVTMGPHYSGLGTIFFLIFTSK